MKKKMTNNARSVLGVSKVWWKGHGEILSDDYTVHHSRGKRAKRDEANSDA